MPHRPRVVAALLALLALLPAPARAEPPKELWLYYSTNLLVDKNIDKLRDVWTRAARAGYTHVLLADSKFARLPEMDRRYFDNCARVKNLAADLKLTVVPALFGVGYSNDLLSQDPNLAEGLPVRDAPFVVRGNVARLEPEKPVAFGPRFDLVDAGIRLDPAVRTATVTDNPGNARLAQPFKLTPYRHYHVSVKVKTDAYTGTPEIKALAAGGHSLQWTNLGVKPTQDWTTHHVTFNSLDHADVRIYLGVWGAAKGTLQWKEWTIEEVGLMNVLRRPGAPLVVKRDGRALVEGTDFDPVKDARMGTVPYPGEYEVWHDAYPTLRTHNLPDGTRLSVSWFHPHLVYDGQVTCCLADPKLNEILADQAKRMRALWSTPGYMMSHDEIRVVNHDGVCRQTGKTPGQLLADNARYCTKLLDGAAVYAWSDMFDPHHNAVKGPYFLVNGTYDGAWEGLDPSVTVMNWNFGKRDASLKFFADRGHRQVIAGYYDGAPAEVKQWLASAAKVRGVVGVMYTTWRNDYSQIETFAKLVRE